MAGRNNKKKTFVEKKKKSMQKSFLERSVSILQCVFAVEKRRRTKNWHMVSFFPSQRYFFLWSVISFERKNNKKLLAVQLTKSTGRIGTIKLGINSSQSLACSAHPALLLRTKQHKQKSNANFSSFLRPWVWFVRWHFSSSR